MIISSFIKRNHGLPFCPNNFYISLWSFHLYTNITQLCCKSTCLDRGIIAALYWKASTFCTYAKYLVKEQSPPVLTTQVCWNKGSISQTFAQSQYQSKSLWKEGLMSSELKSLISLLLQLSRNLNIFYFLSLWIFLKWHNVNQYYGFYFFKNWGQYM